MSQRDPSADESLLGLWHALGSAPPHVRVAMGVVAGALNLWGIDESLPAVFALDGRLLLFGAVTYLARWLIHIEMGYVGFSSAPARRLAFVTIADGAVAMLLVGLGVQAVRSPGAGIIFATVGAGWMCVAVTSSHTARLLRKRELVHLGRGSERFQRFRAVRALKRFLRPLKHVPVFSTVRVLLGWLTPRTQVSAYILALFSSLLLIACSAGAAIETHAHQAVPGVSVPAVVREFNAQTLFPRRVLVLASGAPVHARGAAGSAPQSYAHDCNGWPAPGAGAPPAEGAGLSSLFTGDGAVAGLGASVAGCAYVTHPERGQPLRWWVTGWCGPELRSLAIAWPGGSAIMLEQVAVYARYLAMRGLLLSATARVAVGAGDLQLLQTPYGPVTFVRSATAAGPLAGTPGLGACAPQNSLNVRYVVLPPTLTVLWTQLMAQEGQWLWPVYDRTRRGRAFEFVTAVSGTSVATGRCATSGDCAIVVGGRREALRFGARRSATMGEVLRFAPPPSP